MPVLSIRAIYSVARAAGFTPDQSATWTAIAMAESRGRTGALNSKGEHSVGLWQINVDPNVRANRWGNLNDPMVNARAAYEISRHGRDMRPWTTTHDHNKGTAADYRTYLDDVEAAVGVKGDWRGVSGYNAALPTPLSSQTGGGAYDRSASGSYDQIGQGAPIWSDVDTDSDGLTDDYEVAASHSNPHSQDSDKDALTDGHEVASSLSSPMSPDTDRDTLSDAREESSGTNPAMLDTEHDGLTDAAEVRFGTNPLKAEAGDGTVPQASGLSPSVQPLPATSQTPGVDPAFSGQPLSAAGPTSSKVDRFVQVALNQKGDRYIYGAQTSPSDPDPEAFDCSELTKWAAQQVGVKIPEIAETQYLDLKSHNALISVERALRIKGALLFYFSSEPTATGARPARAHVAISLGNGHTIEARGRAYGVNEFTAGHRFTAAGVIPGLSGTEPAFEASQQGMTGQPTGNYDRIDPGGPMDSAVDSDLDGLTNAFEKLAGTSVTLVDTDRDGMSDTMEALRSHTDPLSRDTDRDRRSDASEVSAGTDAGRIPGIAGVAGQGLFAQNVRGGIKDADKDGLPDVFEVRSRLNPRKADTDGDRLSDASEISTGTAGTSKDTDRDGRTDWLETQTGSDPLKAGSGLGQGAGLGGGPAEGDPFAADQSGTDLDAPPD